MKRVVLVALMVLGCSVPRDLPYYNLGIDSGSVVLSANGLRIGRLEGVDWDWYSGRGHSSYRIELFDPKYRAYEAELVRYVLGTDPRAVEVHVNYCLPQ